MKPESVGNIFVKQFPFMREQDEIVTDNDLVLQEIKADCESLALIQSATTDDGVTPESTIVSDTHNICGLYSISSFHNFFNLIYPFTPHKTSF